MALMEPLHTNLDMVKIMECLVTKYLLTNVSKTNKYSKFVHALVDNGLVIRRSYWNNELLNIHCHLPVTTPCTIMVESMEGYGNKLL